MKHIARFFLTAIIVSMTTGTALANDNFKNAQLGPRPFYLVDKLETNSNLKRKLQQCAKQNKIYYSSVFSIGHRGAPLQFPEHTKESYLAAALMGAGILECDVTFTEDLELVCRHAQCDLHTTTNILATPLAAKCSEPFVPAKFNGDSELISSASARCCTSDITLEEFKSLEGKMDAADTNATTVAAYMGGTPKFRTDLYTTGGTLLTHQESIELFKRLDRKMTPELKSPEVEMPFKNFTQEDYAQKMIDEYRITKVDPSDVWVQSFNLDDVLYWIANNPDFGEQAVYLEGRNPEDLVANPPPLSYFIDLKVRGVNVLAPPMPALLTMNGTNFLPSEYAKRAKAAGLDIISWTTERSGRVNEDIIASDGAFYYNTTVEALQNDGDILRTIDVLVQDVGIFGLFSDWPATTTFYANCMRIPALDDDDEENDD